MFCVHSIRPPFPGARFENRHNLRRGRFAVASGKWLFTAMLPIRNRKNPFQFEREPDQKL
jgi:hypothetical protein